MLKARLVELEAELRAREEAEKVAAGGPNLSLKIECGQLIQSLERDLTPTLGAACEADWIGFLTYRRRLGELVVCRGRAFLQDGMFAKYRAGLDIVRGLDTITDYLRKYDVTPPQELDHLAVNFGISTNKADAPDQKTRVFLWYGENLAPYRLIFEADVEDSGTERALKEAIADGLSWLVRKPKGETLPEFLKTL